MTCCQWLISIFFYIYIKGTSSSACEVDTHLSVNKDLTDLSIKYNLRNQLSMIRAKL